MDTSAGMDALEWFSGVDVYLIDQILKRRFAPGAKILDAGCGGGRNLTWFLRSGFEVFGVDSSAGGIAEARHAASRLAPPLPPNNFQLEAVEQMSFGDGAFDVVLSIAVLHFARNDAHFQSMLREMWRVLRPGGVFFARLASNIGIEELVQPLGDGRYAIPDGSVRYLVGMQTLLQLTDDLGAQLLEPIKTVNVQNQRCMTTWVCRKL